MDEIWKRDEIDSPCVKICVIHPQAGICVGCFRTLKEIDEWSGLTSEQREAISLKLTVREKSLVSRRGGRLGRRANRK